MSGAVRSAAALRRDPRFVEFTLRFNARRFFAAHEVLEELWLEVAGAERDFLQGLIQIAVALEHRARGNGAGAARVLARARRRLRGYGPRHAGLPLTQVLAAVERCLAGTRAAPPRLPALGRARAAAHGAARREATGIMRATRARKVMTAKTTKTAKTAKTAKSSDAKKPATRPAKKTKPAGIMKPVKGRKATKARGPTMVLNTVKAGRRMTLPKPAKESRARAAAPKTRRPEPLEVRRARALAILDGLRRLYPDAHCELAHGSALELLVATILSAQCTDTRVNMTTPALFSRYRTARDYATADLEEVGRIVRSTGFYRNKAKSIVALGKALVERHGGEVPDAMDDLVKLPGVGRKTANVLLAEWFHRPGIAVDTHVIRLTGPVWRLTNETDPVKIEFALYELIPEEDRAFFGIATIFHGRRVCSARRPDCAGCALSAICPSAFAWGGVRPAV